MKDKINKILKLAKLNKFSEAKIIAEDIKKNLQQNYEFLNVYGYILFRLESYEEAIKLYKKILETKPDYIFPINNLANVYSKLNKHEEALSYFNQALKLKPDYFEASYGISEVYFKMRNYENSLLYLNKSINLKPGYLPPIKSKLHLLKVTNQKEDILKFLNQMIIQIPGNAYLYNEKALVLSELGRETEAINSYKNTYFYDRNYPFVLGKIVFDKLMNCEWEKIEENFDEISTKIQKKKEVADPLTVSYVIDSPLTVSESSKIWVKFKNSGKNNEHHFKNKKNKGKINIGYFSADFRDHPIGHLISRTIELHDKSKFCIHGFYFGKKQKKDDYYHLRLKKAFQEYHDVSNKNHDEIVNLSRNLKIDIAIDLMGYTGGFENRMEIFLKKCAPIQINFLGFPGTLGTNKFDYIVADKNLIYEDEKKFYSEKVIFLPNSYQPSEKDRFISNKKFTKKDFNLPEDKFIFCCFNSNQKILRSTFNLWIEILKKTPKSILWLLSKNKNFINNFKNEFNKQNVSSDRIIFSKKLPVDEHLVRIKFADLFLDTFPYNAHTTCSDSIWAGVPLLTKKGKSFHSRVASSLLKTSNLEELITYSDREYIDKAVKIANDVQYLKSLKEKLDKTRDTNPLFNSKFYTKKLEQAFEIIYQRKFENQKPEDIYL